MIQRFSRSAQTHRVRGSHPGRDLWAMRLKSSCTRLWSPFGAPGAVWPRSRKRKHPQMICYLIWGGHFWCVCGGL